MKGWGRVNEKKRSSKGEPVNQSFWKQGRQIPVEQIRQEIASSESLLVNNNPTTSVNSSLALDPHTSTPTRPYAVPLISPPNGFEPSNETFQDEMEKEMSPVSTPNGTPQGTPFRDTPQTSTSQAPYLSYRGSLLERLTPRASGNHKNLSLDEDNEDDEDQDPTLPSCADSTHSSSVNSFSYLSEAQLQETSLLTNNPLNQAHILISSSSEESEEGPALRLEKPLEQQRKKRKSLSSPSSALFGSSQQRTADKRNTNEPSTKVLGLAGQANNVSYRSSHASQSYYRPPGFSSFSDIYSKQVESEPLPPASARGHPMDDNSITDSEVYTDGENNNSKNNNNNSSSEPTSTIAQAHALSCSREVRELLAISASESDLDYSLGGADLESNNGAVVEIYQGDELQYEEQEEDVGCLTDHATVQSFANSTYADSVGTGGPGSSLKHKLNKFFRRIQKYENFAEMNDQELMDRNISMSFTTTDAGDNDDDTLTTTASSLRGVGSALARHLYENGSRGGDLEDDSTSYRTADWAHMSPSLMIFDNSTNTDESRSMEDYPHEPIMSLAELATAAPAGRRSVQFNTDSGNVTYGGPVVIPEPAQPGDEGRKSCLMPPSLIFRSRKNNTDEGIWTEKKKQDKAGISPNRALARRVIRCSAAILILACIVILILLLANVFKKDDSSPSSASVTSETTSRFNAGGDATPSPSLSPVATQETSAGTTNSPSLSPVRPPTVPGTPTVEPSHPPSLEPSVMPSYLPSGTSSLKPTRVPSATPSLRPSVFPSSIPPSAFPSTRPSTTDSRREQYLLSILLPLISSFGGDAAILQEGTPQNEALQILVQDENFESFTNEELVERYGLLVLSISLSTSETRFLREFGDFCSRETCEGGRLVILDWSGKGLENTIPEEIGLLVNLRVLKLQNNNLEGGLPASIGRLDKLRKLQIQGNFLSDPFPDTLKDCTNLELLDASDNEFAMPLPAVLGETKSLKRLLLADNDFDGPIPESYYYLDNLTQLSLEKNHLTGQIGGKIENLVNLESLQLGQNQFTFVSRQVGTLGKLEKLDLSDNQINQSLFDDTFDGLDSIQEIRLGKNLIGGDLPDFSTIADTLEYLDLAENQFVGKIPYSLGVCTKLKVLLLNSNKLTGGFKSIMYYLNALNILRVDDNNIREKVPKDFCYYMDTSFDFWADCATEGSPRPGKLDCKCCTQCCHAKDECLENVGKRPKE